MKYAELKKFDIANGLGVRVTLFVSGCTHHCKNCFNEIAWDFNYGEEFTDEVKQIIFDELDKSYTAGLSVLGGEPFEIINQKGLLPLLKEVKEKYPNKNIWVYTGYLFDEELLKPSRVRIDITDELLSYIDILVDGKFVEELMDLRLKYRGSANQRIINVPESLETNTVVLDPLNELKEFVGVK